MIQPATTYNKEQAALPEHVFCAAVVPKQAHESLAYYWLAIEGLKDNSEHLLSTHLTEILTDSLLEDLWFTPISELSKWCKTWHEAGFKQWAEKQFMPGVTDNLAHIVEEAIEMKNLPFKVKVASGRLYLSKSTEEFDKVAYKLYHPVVERFLVHDLGKPISDKDFLSFPSVILKEAEAPEVINLDLSDAELENISRERVLALSLSEMQAIKAYYKDSDNNSTRKSSDLPNFPTDVELEIIAQTWSEHCKHKIFNAKINHTEHRADGTIHNQQINSLYKSFIQKATKQMQATRTDLLSVFVDNSGVVAWDEKWAICFKAETHNSPSALEPYGGALTGILGVNRDVMGTGLGAKPLFNTDILCFAYPDKQLPQRPKLLPPETIMSGVRKGIQDGGNKSGIPTVNGAIVFDPAYRAKPLVFCGTGGILPLKVNGLSGFGKHTKAGDTIVMAGGRVGKDGIHGATFSSEALHEGSPVTAVQIGDPFTQKRLLDFVLEARDLGLITSITDNGAGGLSSSVGEMAQITGGATIELNTIPTKYPGLADWEIIISESQERMTISTNKFEQLQELALKHHVEVSAIGQFNQSKKFEVTRNGKLVASLDLEFLHDGVPTLELEAETHQKSLPTQGAGTNKNYKEILLKLLSHPNICNRESVIRQYDHEVQGSSVIKPLMGQNQKAACDAAVITPILGSKSGLAVSNGIAPRLSKYDCHLMAVSAVDEAIRNAVCVGADPDTIYLLDNFCWPDPVDSAKNKQGKAYLGDLVMACQGLYEAVTVFQAPLISGKDSMKNDFDDGVVRLSIPPTLLISAIAKVPDIDKCISMEFKNPDDLIYLLSAGTPGLAGSHYAEVVDYQNDLLCSIDLTAAQRLYQSLHQAINKGWINSAHDLSEGGLAVALSECAIGSGLGVDISLAKLQNQSVEAILFGEGPAMLLVSIAPQFKNEFEKSIGLSSCFHLGKVTKNDRLIVNQSLASHIEITVDELGKAWNLELPFA